MTEIMVMALAFYDASSNAITNATLLTQINNNLKNQQIGTIQFVPSDVAAMIALNIATFDVQISVMNCVMRKSQQVIKFTIKNTELGPTIQQAPKTIVVNLQDGIRPPKLSGVIQYFYSNCAITNSKITEAISIEVWDTTTSAFIASSIMVNNGDFDKTLLDIKKTYRVKIIGNAPTGKATPPVYIALIVLAPLPSIDPLQIMAPL